MLHGPPDHFPSSIINLTSLHAWRSTSGVLESVKTLLIEGNKYTDTGIAYFARALISYSTLRTLRVSNDSVKDMGLAPLLEALPRQDSLENLQLHWSL